MSEEGERVYLFSNGTQWADWEECNCVRCVKSVNEWNPGGDELPTCPLELAIYESQLGDGSFAPDMATRIQPPEYEGRYVWPCGEVEWAEWWKEEYAKRKAQRESA